MKALLDSGDLHPVPGCYLEYWGAESAHISAWGVMLWARSIGMELRAHDLVEVENCLRAIAHPHFPHLTAPLGRARGLWCQATSYGHDFDGDGIPQWEGTFSPSEVAQEVKDARAKVEKARKEAEWKAKQADEYELRAANGGTAYDIEQAPIRRADAVWAAETLAREEGHLAEVEEEKAEADRTFADKPRYSLDW